MNTRIDYDRYAYTDSDLRLCCNDCGCEPLVVVRSTMGEANVLGCLSCGKTTTYGGAVRTAMQVVVQG